MKHLVIYCQRMSFTSCHSSFKTLYWIFTVSTLSYSIFSNRTPFILQHCRHEKKLQGVHSRIYVFIINSKTIRVCYMISHQNFLKNQENAIIYGVSLRNMKLLCKTIFQKTMYILKYLRRYQSKSPSEWYQDRIVHLIICRLTKIMIEKNLKALYFVSKMFYSYFQKECGLLYWLVELDGHNHNFTHFTTISKTYKSFKSISQNILHQKRLLCLHKSSRY